MKRYLIGVDEAGRGPLAGPVAVGVVKVPKRLDISIHFPDARDSKVLTEKKREEIYKRMLEYKKRGEIDFVVVLASAKAIDQKGISRVVLENVYKGVLKLAPDAKGVEIRLDGLLSAPTEYKQQTIIKGDALEPVISLASIAAKVHRDRLMVRQARRYAGYGFEVHKGYGTKLHYKNIKKLGLSPLHRTTFCRTFISRSNLNNR
jgi:ribonuclease HII